MIKLSLTTEHIERKQQYQRHVTVVHSPATVIPHHVSVLYSKASFVMKIIVLGSRFIITDAFLLFLFYKVEQG